MTEQISYTLKLTEQEVIDLQIALKAMIFTLSVAGMSNNSREYERLCEEIQVQLGQARRAEIAAESGLS